MKIGLGFFSTAPATPPTLSGLQLGLFFKMDTFKKGWKKLVGNASNDHQQRVSQSGPFPGAGRKLGASNHGHQTNDQPSTVEPVVRISGLNITLHLMTVQYSRSCSTSFPCCYSSLQLAQCLPLCLNAAHICICRPPARLRMNTMDA